MLAWFLRSPRHVASVFVLATVIAAVRSPAIAQGTPPPAASETAEPPGYRDAIDSAIAEYDAGRFAEARALFERAHRLFPNARALRGMGMAEFELRNYPATVYYLEQALASPIKPLANELRTETEHLLARARTFVGRVKLTLEPPGASIALNGTSVQLPPEGVLHLIVGDYTLQVSATGYGTEQRALRVAGGEEQTITVQLPKHVDVLTPVAPPEAAKADESDSVFASPWLWAAVGVVVAGAAVGVGLAASGGEAELITPNGGSSKVVVSGP